MRRALNILLSLASAALLVLAAQVYRADQEGRKPARTFLTKFDVETRRPDVAHTVGYAPTPDWAAVMIADAALRDAYEPVSLLDVTPEVREAWIKSAAHVDEELVYARDALLDAIATRPGWPFNQSLLGETVFAIESRAFSRDLTGKPQTWALPLLNAARGAPAAGAPWRSLAAGYLQTWPLLAKQHGATAEEVFQHAFADADFLRAALPDAARLLGTDRAVRYVPDTPRSLATAFDFFAKADDVPRAWSMRQRWTRAEWDDRQRDLAAIERHARRGDDDDVRSLSEQWLAQHSVWDFDSPAAHEQAARLLALAAGGRRGAWSRDPFADVARYLLSRNVAGDPYAAIVARRIDDFEGVPAPVAAEVKLRGGEVEEAERIARSADDAGSFAWTTYLLTLARRDKTRAADALARMPATALQTHEAMIVRGVERAAVSASATLRCGQRTEQAVPGARDRRTVVVRLSSVRPSLIDIGVNRARSATLLVDGERDIAFTLIGWRDKTIWTSTLCGANENCASIVTPATLPR